MVGDLISMPLSDISKLIFGIQPVKVGSAAAAGANQQVLMALCTSENRLALAKMMDAVDQSQFLKFFDSPIYRDQTDVRHYRSRLIKDLRWGYRPAARGEDIKDHPSRARDAIAALAELIFPFFCCFGRKIIHDY
jgi:hypothetical protein